MNDVHESRKDRFLNLFPKILFAVTLTLLGVVVAASLLQPAERGFYSFDPAVTPTVAMDTTWRDTVWMDTMAADTIYLGEGVEVVTVWDSLLADSIVSIRHTSAPVVVEMDSTGANVVVGRLPAGTEYIGGAVASPRLPTSTEGLGEPVRDAATLNLKGAMSAVVTLILLVAALWVILSKRYEDDARKWAFGAIGTIVGYWLSP